MTRRGYLVPTTTGAETFARQGIGAPSLGGPSQRRIAKAGYGER